MCVEMHVLPWLKIICLIKSCQFKDILEEVSVSLLRSTTKRCPHECKYRGLQLKSRKVRLNFDREHLKESAHFGKNFWTDETKISMCQNDGKSKEKERNSSCERITLTVKHWERQYYGTGMYDSRLNQISDV